MGLPFCPMLPLGTCGWASRRVRVGEIRDTWFLRSPKCTEVFMVQVIREMVQQCGRAERARSAGRGAVSAAL